MSLCNFEGKEVRDFAFLARIIASRDRKAIKAAEHQRGKICTHQSKELTVDMAFAGLANYASVNIWLRPDAKEVLAR